MFESSQIEISRSALKQNIRFLRRQIGKKTIFSSVVKGNAYGHGIAQFIPLAENCGLRHFSVFSAREAFQVFKARISKSQILIMGDMEPASIPWAIRNGISFYLFDFERLKLAIKIAKSLGLKAKIHLEFETGLNRTGFSLRTLRRVLKLLAENMEYLELEGLCTHYAGAESLNNFYRIQNQIKTYNQLYQWVINQVSDTIPNPEKVLLRHTACSAASLLYPETIMDMVRIGIAQYGFWPSKETEIHFYSKKSQAGKSIPKRNPLVRVLKWKTRVMSQKKVKRGDYVGYGSTSLITRDMILATVPVGYSHGFSRDLSNKGHVLIHGKRAPVVGLVNMNMLMVDITDIAGVQNGDEVVIIGKQGELSISVGAFGELTRFINYEVLVGLPSEIPRIVVD